MADFGAQRAGSNAQVDVQLAHQTLDSLSFLEDKRQASAATAPGFQDLSSPLKLAAAQADSSELDLGRVQCVVGAGGVKAPAAMTYNMTADTLPHLSHVQRWPYEEAAHSQAADQGTELLAYWADYSTDRPQALGQLDLPHHDGALSMPVTPNTERIMMNDAATAQQPAEAAACSPTAGVPFPLHSMPGFGGHFEPHSEAMLLPDGFAMPSSMEIAHFHHQELPDLDNLPDLSQLPHISGPRSVQSMPHMLLAEPHAQATAYGHEAMHSVPMERRYSQPAAARGFPEAASTEDSQSEEDKPARKRRRGARRLTCSNCATHQTPQWRCGPGGPRTLCNACGVRFKKGLPMTGIAAAAAAAEQHDPPSSD